MDDRLKACCAGFYELPIVATLLGGELHPGGRTLTRRLASAALVGRDSVVLDVACGRGESARLLASHFACRVVGLDYSLDSVAQAIALSKETPVSDRVRFVHGEAERLPFDAERFDVVICECSLCTFPDLLTALEEMRRVLRPGGRLAISDVVLNEAVPAALQDVFGRAICISGALPIEGYRDALSSVGFSRIRCQDVSAALVDMIAGIERRARAVGRFLDADDIELREGLTVSRPQIAEARDFVKTGGIGYALLLAKKRRKKEEVA